jgi:pimeloyl-ACP methyl ester carboxylesterase
MLTEKFFNAGSLKINYAEGPANGAPLVLLHGGTARWQELDPLITNLEGDWHVYACDLRGHGRSDRAESYRIVDFIPDIVAFIRDQIGAPTVLAGHSLGSLVSIGTATLIPDLIQNLILLDPPLYLREESIKSNYVYDYFRGVYAYLTKRRTAQEVLSELFPGITEEGIRNMEASLSCVDPIFVNTLLEDCLMEGWDIQASLESILCPTLLLYGEIEKGAVVRDGDVEFFRKHISIGREFQIKDASHLLQVDQPARVLEAMTKFLRKS